jgi:hypothetical protein
MDELSSIMSSLSKELYLSKLDAVIDNLRRSATYFNAEDWMFDHLPGSMVSLLQHACNKKNKGTNVIGEYEGMVEAHATVSAKKVIKKEQKDIDAPGGIQTKSSIPNYCVPTIPSIILQVNHAMRFNSTEIMPSTSNHKCACDIEVTPLSAELIEHLLEICGGANCCWPSSPVYFGPSVFNGALPTSTCARILERIRAYRCNILCSNGTEGSSRFPCFKCGIQRHSHPSPVVSNIKLKT